MAEALTRYKLEEKGYNWDIEVFSAGLATQDGLPANSKSEEVMMREKGIDISSFRSMQLTEEILEDMDLIFVMTRDQRDLLHQLFPEHSERIHLISVVDDDDIERDVEDPYGQGYEQYKKTADMLEQLIDKIILSMLGEENEDSISK